MLNICCVKTGTKYGPEYVNILCDMVQRNLPEGTPGRFICFTDDREGISDGIEVRDVPPLYADGWWAKLYLFSSAHFELDEHILYIDLDTVITGPLDKLLTYDGDFAILRDPFDPGIMNSGVMMWKNGALTEVWCQWLRDGKPRFEGGDQEWIQRCVPRADLLQELYPKKFFSFKKDCFNGLPPRESMVVYFHGEPKPHNCGVEWVKNVWKIGGGSASEIELICNTADDIIKANIRSACKRNIPWIDQRSEHEGHAVIVCGGPSLKGQIDELKWRYDQGHEIFATNNTAQFLAAHGIMADYQVIVDARADNAKFIIEEPNCPIAYIASQCHPSVFAASADIRTVLWHSWTHILEEAIENPYGKPECFIACGSTVGLSTMGIAYALGFRQLHIYGMDSCYEADEHHAYPQALNDNEVIIDVMCAGRMFKCSSWMVSQADQFQVLVGELMKGGCEISVHGKGLIPWIALNFQADEIPDTQMHEIDGVWWPSRDEVARPAVLSQLQYLDKLLRYVPNAGTAVQAGGNVGLVPRAMSEHVDEVFTFEPDPLNYSCMLKNLNGHAVVPHKTALSDVVTQVGLAGTPRNCGAHFAVEGDTVTTQTIDNLGLSDCSLIQLDVEGYEMKALRGAEETIRLCRPVICVEQNGLGERYGTTDKALTEWLTARDYVAKERIFRDVVYIPKERDE